jgi:hypothetical protein
MSRLLILGLGAACALTVAACGSSGTPSGSNSTRSSLANQALAYSRCMRSHGVTNFPDPTSNGGLSYHGSTSSPAFNSAQTACASLEPRKVAPSSGHETPQQAAQDHAKLLRWAECMRHHGYPELPDAKIGTPQPTPGYGTVLGWGAAYLQIPASYDAHSQAFLNTAKTCGINPRGNPHH